MSNKVHITEKGTRLPLINLKGKDYLMVAHRIVWFREVYPTGMILTEPVKIEKDYAIFKATIAVPNAQGIMTTLATATKFENVQGFQDFIEKSETGSCGRALALAGFGTQFALPELDEGDRLADSPLQSANTSHVTEKFRVVSPNHPLPKNESTVQVNIIEDKTEPLRTSFRRPTTTVQAKPTSGWSK